MVIRDGILIDASIEHTWNIVSNPDTMAVWNDHVVRVTSPGSPPVVGRTYSIMYSLSGKVNECTGEVVTVDAPRLLVIHVTSNSIEPKLSAEERYELEERNGSTFVSQRVTVRSPRIPFPFNILIWYVSRYGKPTGRRMLERLKDLVETGKVEEQA